MRSCMEPGKSWTVASVFLPDGTLRKEKEPE